MTVGRQVALLIGYNGHTPWKLLSGAENDPALIRGTYEEAGYSIPDAAVLTGARATRKNLRLALSALATYIPEKMLLHFSGHGGLDDGVIGLLFNHNRLVKLSDVERDIWELCPTVQQFICVLDSCRNDPSDVEARSFDRRSETYTDGFSPQAMDDLNHRWVPAAARSGTTHGNRQGWPGGAVCFFGCEPERKCFESDGHGDFTRVLVEAITVLPADDPIPVYRLATHAEKLLQRYGRGQRPHSRGHQKITVRDMVVTPPTSSTGSDSLLKWPDLVSGSVEDVFVGNDIGVLLTSDGTCVLVTSRGVEKLLNHRGSVSSAAVSADGSLLCVQITTSDQGSLDLWHVGLNGPQPLRHRQARARARSLAFSPDRKLLSVLWKNPDGHSWLEVLSLDDWSHPDWAPGISNVHQLAWLTEDELLIGTDTTVYGWRMHQGNPEWEHSLNSVGPPIGVAVSRDGAYVGWCTWDGSVSILDVLSQRVKTLRHDVPITTIAFGPDSRSFFCGAANGVVYFYKDGDEVARRVVLELSGIVSSIAVTIVDGRVVAGSSRGRIKTWKAD